MIYVVSDIHGCYDKYTKMLELIDLKEEDTLYILGDVIDRGDNPLDIIDHIRATDNIIYVKGNHEEMMEDYLSNKLDPLKDEEEDIDFSYSWFDNIWFRNGGGTTHKKLKEKSFEYVVDLYNYICDLPMSATVVLKDGRQFFLAHAGVCVPYKQENLSHIELLSFQDEETLLWDRAFVESEIVLQDYTVICGHTPVQTVTNDIDNVSIIHKNGKILIDCGAVFTSSNGKLACLRLDDMKEFYV